ncbi:MAG: hypothetical protein ACR2PX_27580 [Endozoicomonas sp.]|uniref:hypothetical protein n=1 Tax=Endozoicomonas sp. TaxID=1892382 RepID=UPI003D9BBE7C
MATIGQCLKTACIVTSRLAALPGAAIGYAGGRVVGAVAGATIVGGAKLSNKLFKTTFQPKSINDYSKITAKVSGSVGALASKIVVASATGPILGVPIILGTVFDIMNQVNRAKSQNVTHLYEYSSGNHR